MLNRLRRRLVMSGGIVCASLFVLSISSIVAADDWPQWGGPHRDLVWRETGIVDKLPTSGLLPRVWSTPIGEGYSGPAVSAGRVYITDFVNRRGRQGTERVLCLDAEIGDLIWKHEYPVHYQRLSYNAGPRSTPVIDSGRVYTIGAMGNQFCFDEQSGDILWQFDFVQDYGTIVPQWGMVASPLVDGNQLITLVGGQNNALVVSFDKNTGRELWRNLGDSEPGYCPPVMYEQGEVRQVIIWHPSAVSALNPQTGEVVWQIPFRVSSGLCVPMPRQVGNRIFVTAFYNGGRMIEVSPDGQQARIVWKGRSNSEQRTDGLHSIIPTPIVSDTHIYGVCSYGQLRCLDAKTGRRLWETFEATGHGRWWNAFLIPHEDRVFLHNEQGDLIIANLTPRGYQETSRAKLVAATRPLSSQGRVVIWSHPAFAMKSVFARNDKEIVRVNLAAD